MQNKIIIEPRYYRWHVDKGVVWAEKNTGYAHLNWEIPIAQTALVLIDVWSHHYLLGFNTNACILMRDYGTLAMGRRGYEIILLRDCTTGMESFETHENLGQTRGAVLFLEMFGHYSLTSGELIAGLPG